MVLIPLPLAGGVRGGPLGLEMKPSPVVIPAKAGTNVSQYSVCWNGTQLGPRFREGDDVRGEGNEVTGGLMNGGVGDVPSPSVRLSRALNLLSKA